MNGSALVGSDALHVEIVNCVNGLSGAWQPINFDLLSETANKAVMAVIRAGFVRIKDQIAVSHVRQEGHLSITLERTGTHDVADLYRCIRPHCNRQWGGWLRKVPDNIDLRVRTISSMARLTDQGEAARADFENGLHAIVLGFVHGGYGPKPEITIREVRSSRAVEGDESNSVAAFAASQSISSTGDVHFSPTIVVENRIDPSTVQQPQPKAAKSGARKSSKSHDFTGGETKILAALQWHHAKNCTPMQGNRLADSAKVSEATVTRFLEKYMEGRVGYEAACSRGSIKEKLSRLAGDGIAYGTADPSKLDR